MARYEIIFRKRSQSDSNLHCTHHDYLQLTSVTTEAHPTALQLQAIGMHCCQTSCVPSLSFQQLLSPIQALGL